MSEDVRLPDVSPGNGTGVVTRAARRAIARARRRGDEFVTPDDLLLGLLGEASRFGVALVGEWTIDVEALEAGADARPPDGADADPRTPAPAYSAEAVRLFEKAAELAREDGAVAIGPTHLLAACAWEPPPLLAELGQVHGFGPAEWRGALARGALGPWASPADGARAGVAGGRGRSVRVPDLMSVDDAAAYLGVHAQTVRNYIRGGKLPAYRLAGERYIRVLRKDLLGLLERVGSRDAERSDPSEEEE